MRLRIVIAAVLAAAALLTGVGTAVADDPPVSNQYLGGAGIQLSSEGAED
ncbi:hypothetical protein ACFXPI_12210 [Streptomyces sp. NPDC059104]